MSQLITGACFLVVETACHPQMSSYDVFVGLHRGDPNLKPLDDRNKINDVEVFLLVFLQRNDNSENLYFFPVIPLFILCFSCCAWLVVVCTMHLLAQPLHAIIVASLSPQSIWHIHLWFRAAGAKNAGILILQDCPAVKKTSQIVPRDL